MIHPHLTLNQALQIPAVTFCLLSCFLAGRNNAWTFVMSYIMAFFYCIIDYRLRIYADMSSQVVLILFQIYGLYQWKFSDNHRQLVIRYASIKQCVLLLCVCVVTAIAYAFVLSHYTNSTLLWLDITTTVATYAALWMLAKKYVQNWWLWIVVNIESTLLYSVKGMYLSGMLYLTLIGLASYGLLQWRRLASLSSVQTASLNKSTSLLREMNVST
jgi:nicotinamide mononucleotide transporter